MLHGGNTVVITVRITIFLRSERAWYRLSTHARIITSLSGNKNVITVGEMIKGRGDITHEICSCKLLLRKLLHAFLDVCECKKALANYAMLSLLNVYDRAKESNCMSRTCNENIQSPNKSGANVTGTRLM